MVTHAYPKWTDVMSRAQAFCTWENTTKFQAWSSSMYSFSRRGSFSLLSYSDTPRKFSMPTCSMRRGIRICKSIRRRIRVLSRCPLARRLLCDCHLWRLWCGQSENRRIPVSIVGLRDVSFQCCPCLRLRSTLRCWGDVR